MRYYTLQVLVTSFSCILVCFTHLDFSAWGGREPGGSGKGTQIEGRVPVTFWKQLASYLVFIFALLTKE